MTEAEFLAEVQYAIENEEIFPLEEGYAVRFRVKEVPGYKPIHERCCPITALAAAKGLCHVSISDFETAAEKLGIDKELMNKIISAADFSELTLKDNDMREQLELKKKMQYLFN